MRHSIPGSPREAAPSILSVTVSDTTADHWLSEIGHAFELTNEIAWCDWPTEDGPTLIELHDSAVFQYAEAIQQIELRAARAVASYERDRYYVGESVEQAATMRAVLAAAHESVVERERAEQRAWVCREEVERHGYCEHCERAYVDSAGFTPRYAGFAPFALVSVGEDGGFTTKH